MTKKIFKSIFSVASIVLIASLSIAITFLYDYFNTSQVNRLKEELSIGRKGNLSCVQFWKFHLRLLSVTGSEILIWFLNLFRACCKDKSRKCK